MPESGLTKPRAALVILSFLSVMVLMYYAARSRSVIGTRGFGADRMFAELRDRIALVGRVPVLPDGWRVATRGNIEVVLSVNGKALDA